VSPFLAFLIPSWEPRARGGEKTDKRYVIEEMIELVLQHWGNTPKGLLVELANVGCAAAYVIDHTGKGAKRPGAGEMPVQKGSWLEALS
jgi:hypothetical protein